jgi:hypothetical protein
MSVYSVNLVPAYGRDYKHPEEVIADWKAGKDFRIADIGNRWDGKYTSIRDWEGEAVRIRYNRLADFVIIGANSDAE